MSFGQVILLTYLASDLSPVVSLSKTRETRADRRGTREGGREEARGIVERRNAPRAALGRASLDNIKRRLREDWGGVST